MSTSRFRFLSIFLMTLFLLPSTAAFSGQGFGPLAFEPGAQEGPRFHRGSRHGRRQAFRDRLSRRLIEGLQLTEEQQTQIREQRRQHREEVQALHEQQRGLRQELRSMLEAESPSAAEVGERVIAIHGLSNQIRQERESAQEAFRALLTPEQLDRLDELKEERPRRRGRR